MKKVDTLDELKASFGQWRTKKRYAREQVPAELFDRACRAVQVHGLKAVLRVTKLKRSQLEKGAKFDEMTDKVVPPFSRLEFTPPLATPGPIAEVETATGVKLRVYTSTVETLQLLSSVCGIGNMP